MKWLSSHDGPRDNGTPSRDVMLPLLVSAISDRPIIKLGVNNRVETSCDGELHPKYETKVTAASLWNCVRTYVAEGILCWTLSSACAQK